MLYLYLKFLCIWRFFRAWALLDGVYPPENMPQCIIMTTSVADFWKGWHSSYNKWCVRYMYIPLGGNMSGGRQKKAIPASATGIKAVEGTGGGGGTKITSINIPASSCTTVVRTLRRVINIALIFTFVAVWHDQEMNLLAWGWLMLLCMIPELVAGTWSFAAVVLTLQHASSTHSHFKAVPFALQYMPPRGSIPCPTVMRRPANIFPLQFLAPLS